MGLIKYDVGHFGEENFKTVTLPRAIEREQRLLLQKAQRTDMFRIRNWGDKPNSQKDDFWGPAFKLATILDRSRTRLKTESIGYRHIIGVDEGDKVKPIVTTYKTEVAPKIQDVVGSPAIDVVYTYVFKRFPKASNLGTWYCRYVDGTWTVSKHGYRGTSQQADTQEAWFAAAIDFGPSGQMDVLQDIFDFCIYNSVGDDAIFRRTGLILFKDKAWSPSQGLHQSGANYHYHVHYETDEGYPCSP